MAVRRRRWPGWSATHDGPGQPDGRGVRPRQDRLRARPSTGAPSTSCSRCSTPRCASTARATWSRRTACWASRTCSRTSPTRPSASSASCWSCAPTTTSTRCSIRRGSSSSSTACARKRRTRSPRSRSRARSATTSWRRATQHEADARCAAQARIVTYEKHSYAVNFIPFGAGQFQNGERTQGLGVPGRRGGAGRDLGRRVRDELRAVRRQPPAPLPGSVDQRRQHRRGAPVHEHRSLGGGPVAQPDARSRSSSGGLFFGRRASGASSTRSATSSRRCRPSVSRRRTRWRHFIQGPAGARRIHRRLDSVRCRAARLGLGIAFTF